MRLNFAYPIFLSMLTTPRYNGFVLFKNGVERNDIVQRLTANIDPKHRAVVANSGIKATVNSSSCYLSILK